MAESNFLVVATSGRAIAQGLKALGYSVIVIDGFADQDTIAATLKCKKVTRTQFGLEEAEVLKAIQALQADYTFAGLFYDAAIEANPQLLNKINIEKVIANSIETLQRCKDPRQFFPVLQQHSVPYPKVRYDADVEDTRHYLLKHAHSTGGVGVSAVSGGSNMEFNPLYLQKIIEGISFSITFLANGEDVYILGANTQWSECLNDSIPYAYAGAINQVKLSEEIIATAVEYAQIIAKEFNLVGLNSIDYIFNENNVYVLEVNPRIPATYELYETKYGDLIQEHIEACMKKKLPAKKRTVLLRAHAIVYAPEDIQVREDMDWPLWTADRPHSGEYIPQYNPICNVFSGGKNYTQVCEMIATRKKSILNKLIT